MPFPSTRIWPSLVLVATAIVVPLAAALGDGFGDGLAAAVEGEVPPQATASSAEVMAAVIKSLCMHPDTEPGYDEGATPASRTRR